MVEYSKQMIRPFAAGCRKSIRAITETGGLMILNRENLNDLIKAVPGSKAFYRIRDGKFSALYVSPSLHAFVGLGSDVFDRISEGDAADLIVPDDLQGVRSAVRRCVEQGEDVDHYWRVRHARQGFVWVHGYVRCCGELDGCPVLLVVFASDSSEMDLYKDVADNSQDMIYVCDCHTYEILYANRAAGEYGGNLGVNLLGCCCYSYIHGRQTPCDDCFLKSVKRGESLRRVRFNPVHRTWEQLSGKYITWCGHDAFIQYIHDITESENLRNQLAESKKLYDIAVDGAGLSVWEYDIPGHRILGGNQNFSELGFTGNIDGVPESILPRFREDSRAAIAELYRLVGSGQPSVSADVWLQAGNGRPESCQRMIYTVVRDGGAPVRAYGLSMDVTAEKHEQTAFERSMDEILAANPMALCTYRIDLTNNTSSEGRGTSEVFVRLLESPTADGIFENTARLIPDRSERARFEEIISRKNLLQTFSSGLSGASIEYQRLGDNGKSIWVRTSVRMLKNPEKGAVEGIVYSLDISEEKQQEEIFRILAGNEYSLIALLHLDTGKFETLQASDRLPQSYRKHLPGPGEFCDFGEFTRRNAGSIPDPQERRRYLENSDPEHLLRVLDSEGRCEFSVRAEYPDMPGGLLVRRLQHYYLGRDRSTVLALITDTTEAWLKQQAEERRAREEAHLAEDVIDSVATGICVLRMPDPDHLCGSFVNLQMFRILGLTPPDGPDARENMLGDPMIETYMKDAFAAVYPEDRERVRSVFHDNFSSQHFSAGNYRLVKKDGNPVWVSQDAILREKKPEYRLFYVTYRIVDREVMLQDRLERQLKNEQSLRRQADSANAAKSDFLSRMSHDLRTPLNVILGLTHLSLERPHSAKTEDELKKISLSSRFMLGLINDVLDMSKAESGKIRLNPEPYSRDEFSEYVEAIVRPLCEGKGLKLDFSMQPAEGAVPLVDRLRANQVLFNLLSNASKFTPEGGVVRIGLSGSMTPGGKLRIRTVVSDTGVGMSREFQKEMFDPFTQEQRNDASLQRGTGLGLSIVKKIVDLMGGSIEVQSELGKGTAFTLTCEFDWVPADRQGTVKRLSARGSLAGLAGKHILLCEDHPLNQEIAKALLEEKNMLVDIADNGQIGVEKFIRSAPRFYDAVLMDIRMPVMDGYEAARAVRALDRQDAATVPIIAMTADAFTDDMKKCLDAGMNGYVAKPIDPDALYREIQTWTEHRLQN